MFLIRFWNIQFESLKLVGFISFFCFTFSSYEGAAKVFLRTTNPLEILREDTLIYYLTAMSVHSSSRGLQHRILKIFEGIKFE